MIAGLIFKSMFENQVQVLDTFLKAMYKFSNLYYKKQPSILEYQTNGLRTDHFKQTVTR